MAAVSPETTIGSNVRVYPAHRIPAAFNSAGVYRATGSALGGIREDSIDIESVKWHCFRFAAAADGDTFSRTSNPKCPTGIVQAFILGEVDSLHVNCRVTSSSSIRFELAAGTGSFWLLVATR